MKVSIPGSWIADPLLRERYMSSWVSIDSQYVSIQAVEAVRNAISSGKDPSTMNPWWLGNPSLVDAYENYRKQYATMNDRKREETANMLEMTIGLEKVSGPTFPKI